MIRVQFLIFLSSIFIVAISSGCVETRRHAVYKPMPPGHVQHMTGYNPASGKFHPNYGKKKGHGHKKGKGHPHH